MNLVEALRTKRPIRRGCFGDRGLGWISCDYVLAYLSHGYTDYRSGIAPTARLLRAEDLLADDWEVKPPGFPQTRKEAAQRLDAAFEKNTGSLKCAILDELGFE